MQSVLQFTAQQFGRAIVMPNLFEPITSTSRAEVYREVIMEALGDLKIKSKFELQVEDFNCEVSKNMIRIAFLGPDYARGVDFNNCQFIFLYLQNLKNKKARSS